MEKKWIDNWLSHISQGKLQDLSKFFSVLKDCQEELGTNTFEIPYQAFHDKGVKGNIQDWLKNLHRKRIITIWYKNKSHGTMRFSVGAPYDEYEEKHISSGAEIELNPEKFEALYMWLDKHGIGAHELNKGFCKLENDTFFITLNDGTEKSIPFETIRETKYMLILFKVLYQHWQKNGSIPLEKEEIRIRMRKEGIKQVTDTFIKNTIGNIRKKIKAAKLSDRIAITYNDKSGGYSLDIKKPYLTNTP